MPRLEPRLSQFGPAFAWLLDKDVSSTRVASLFQTTPANVRVIAFRARHSEPEGSTEDAALGNQPSPELAEELGVRPTPDEVVRTPVGAKKLARLRNEIDSTVNRYSTQYRFLDGIAAFASWLLALGTREIPAGSRLPRCCANRSPGFSYTADARGRRHAKPHLRGTFGEGHSTSHAAVTTESISSKRL